MDADAVATRTEVLRSHIRDIPDFPQPGVVFKDITPLLGDPHGFRATIDGLAEPYEAAAVTKVLGVEARGFIAAAPVADRLRAGFIPVRKPGKLPWQVEKQEYVLEYGTDLLEIHRDAVEPGDRVLIVDDVMATGGTAAAAVRLVERLGGQVIGLSFIIELAFLGGRRKIGHLPIVSLIVYE